MQLFNGKDLTGWKVHPQQANKWKVDDGVLVGTGGHSNLFSGRGDYRDFELRLEGRISEKGNSGVMIRSEYGLDFDMAKLGGLGRMPRGMEVDLHPGIQPQPAGSIWHLGEPDWVERASRQLVRPDKWFTLNILAQGKRLEVKVDGITVLAEVHNKVSYDSGHIALLHQMGGTGQVWFRKIEIRELSPPSPVAPSDPKQAADSRLRRLKLFDPKQVKPVPPAWADAKKAVTVENDAWRIENDTNMGNFHILMATVLEDIPKDGIIVCRAKVKVEARHKDTWGDLMLGEWGPSHYQYDWPAAKYEYRGDVPEWTAKEVRYPASAFHEKDPPQIAIRFGLHANGVLWVKDLELLHLPAEPTAPAPTEVP